MPLQNEKRRLEALRQLDLLDTDESEAFDRITRLAARLFGTPVSLVTLLEEDRQWFKSRVGTQIRETPIEQAFCRFTIQSDQVMVVPDAREDVRFVDNPLVTENPNVRFYAGAPLITRDGHGLGSLCILDIKPRDMSIEDQKALQDLAAMVMAQIDLLHAIGHVDAFSGLPNRNQLYDDLKDLGQEYAGAPYVMMVIDLIGLAQIDRILQALGSLHADELIRESASMVRQALGKSPTLYHLDTGRYVCLLEDDGGEPWRALADQLTLCFNDPISCSGVPIDITLRVGLASFRLGETDGPDVIRAATSAALIAREANRAMEFYTADTDKLQRRSFAMLNDMRKALAAKDQFTLAYQPRVDFKTGACLSVEALLRWTHPVSGPISPAEFIPLAEETALMEPLTDWVMNEAIAQAALWKKHGIDMVVSINISARNLEERDFTQRLIKTLARHNVPTDRIELEFTESALMRDGETILAQLRELEALGFVIAIDDFGSGYSNYAYLQKLPAQTIKIDQSLIRPLIENERDRTIVRSTIVMMHDLGYRVVAEGIETQDIYDLLAEWGCDEAQGYLLARPMKAEALAAWLAARP